MTPREFTDTFVPLEDSLYRVAFYILESEEDARDMVQDLYVKLWSTLDLLDSVHNPRAYCITLIRNMCLDRLRRASHMQKAELSDTIPDDVTLEDPEVERKEKVRRMMEAISDLSEGQRTVLRLKVIDDLSYEEISQKTGMNYLTLRVLLSQARNRLRRLKI